MSKLVEEKNKRGERGGEKERKGEREKGRNF